MHDSQKKKRNDNAYIFYATNVYQNVPKYFQIHIFIKLLIGLNM